MEMTMPLQADPLQTALQHELRRGERVLWQGRALGQLDPKAFATWLFAIPWTAFALFWTYLAWTGTSQIHDGSGFGTAFAIGFPLFGLPFVLVGFWMLAMPFLAMRNASSTIYAVTDQRLVQLYLGRKLKVDSVEADQIGRMSRSEKPDGSGTLAISTERKGGAFRLGEVADIREAEARVRELVERAARGSQVSS
jgi:hypothetical protein